MTDSGPRDPRIEAAYRDTPRDEPSPALDERIRAAARDAVGSKAPTDAARSRTRLVRWRTRVALAASVVLAVGLALVVEQATRQASSDRPSSLAPTVSRPAPADDVRRPTSAPSESALRAQPTEKRRDAARTTTSPSRPMTPDEGSASTIAPSGGEGAESAFAPGAPAVRDGQALGPQRRLAPMNDVSPPLHRERLEADRPERATRDHAQSVAPVRSPAEWIESMRRLKAQGFNAEVAAELTAFRERYPSYPIPADLAP